LSDARHPCATVRANAVPQRVRGDDDAECQQRESEKRSDPKDSRATGTSEERDSDEGEGHAVLHTGIGPLAPRRRQRVRTPE
jgi:hypothetical protein